MPCSLFFTEDPKKASYGSSILATPSGALSPQHVPPIWRHFHLYVVLSPLPRDRPLTAGKGRCGYSVTVVYFRKLRNNGKVGSGRKGGTVIRLRFYKLGCNYGLLKLHHEKDE